MGRLDRIKKAQEASNANTFNPVVLNEGTVQHIFDNCIAGADTQNVAIAALFPTALGYKSGSEKAIHFDAEMLLKNKTKIEYLFGQLYRVHHPNGSFKMSVVDFNTIYQNEYWTSDKATLLKLLYLGVSSKTNFIYPFTAETSTSMISPQVKPTLSPADPNFEAWWKEHKAEWEAKKEKDGREAVVLPKERI